MSRFLCLTILVLYCNTPSLAILPFDPDLKVPTTFGIVQGTDLDESYGFLGIPFGKPPTGALRYTAPQPPEPWTDILPVEKYPPGCIQKCAEPPDACPTEVCIHVGAIRLVYIAHNVPLLHKLQQGR